MRNQTPLQLNDVQFFGQVFDRYFASLCLYASYVLSNRQDAEDLVVNLFTKLWGSKKIFHDEAHLKAYLYRAVKNESLKTLRDQVRHTKGNATLQTKIEQVEEGHLNEIVKREVVRSLHEAIVSLQPDEQEIIRLGYLEGKSNQEIADKLGLALQTVKNKKLRALAFLRKRLPKDQFTLLLLLPEFFYFAVYQ